MLDSSHEYSKLDIDFRLVQPDGLHVVIEHRNGENFHEYAGGKILPGPYKFCFDNKFSTFSTKLVYFEVEVVSQENENRDSNEKFEEDKEQELEKYQVKVHNVSIVYGIGWLNRRNEERAQGVPWATPKRSKMGYCLH